MHNTNGRKHRTALHDMYFKLTTNKIKWPTDAVNSACTNKAGRLNSIPGQQGCNERGQMGHNALGTRMSQQCRKYFLQYSTFTPKKTHVWTWGCQTCFLPQAPSNLVTSLLVRSSQELINNAVSISASCLLWVSVREGFICGTAIVLPLMYYERSHIALWHRASADVCCRPIVTSKMGYEASIMNLNWIIKD